MNGSSLLPSLETLKTQAKRLRVDLDAGGQNIGHGRSLELLAHQHGYKDWNTFHAAIDNQTPSCPVMVGQNVRGAYLDQLFQGVVTGIQSLTHADRFRVTLSFDEPVDVVTFESFSNFRSRVSCVIDRDGETLEKTSNGQPQLRLHF